MIKSNISEKNSNRFILDESIDSMDSYIYNVSESKDFSPLRDSKEMIKGRGNIPEFFPTDIHITKYYKNVDQFSWRTEFDFI